LAPFTTSAKKLIKPILQLPGPTHGFQSMTLSCYNSIITTCLSTDLLVWFLCSPQYLLIIIIRHLQCEHSWYKIVVCFRSLSSIEWQWATPMNAITYLQISSNEARHTAKPQNTVLRTLSHCEK